MIFLKEKDINVKIQDVLLNVRAVAIIVHDNKVLFQKRKQDEEKHGKITHENGGAYENRYQRFSNILRIIVPLLQ